MVLSICDNDNSSSANLRNNSIRVKDGYLEKEKEVVAGRTHLEEDAEEVEEELDATDDIARLSFGSLASSSFEEMTSQSKEPSAPWKVSLKKTGKGEDVREGVSLASPITFYPKDDSRLIHAEASSLQLKHAETQARKGKSSTNLNTPKLKSPVLSKNTTSRGRSPSPGPQSLKNRSPPSTQSLQQPEARPPAELEREVSAPLQKAESKAAPRINSPKTEEEVPAPTANIQIDTTQKTPATEATASDKKLFQLEEQVQDLQQQLLQNQKQFQVLTIENTKLKQELVKPPCESCVELRGSNQRLQQDAAKWKVQTQKSLEEQGCQSCQVLSQSMEETNGLKAQLQESLDAAQQEKESFKKQLTEQLQLEINQKELQQTLSKENEILKLQLEEQDSNAQSMRQELGAANKRAQEHVQQELQQTVLQFQKDKELLQQQLEEKTGDIQSLRDTLQASGAESRECLQQSLEENSAALTAGHDRIAELKADVLRVEQPRQGAENNYPKTAKQQQMNIDDMKQHYEELQEELKWTKIERETLKGVVAEKEQALAATTAQLQDAEASLAAVTEEKELVLDQLTLTTEKCKAAITVTEEMKVSLRDDEEEIQELQTAVTKLESEREELRSKLNLISSGPKHDAKPQSTNTRLECEREELTTMMNLASAELDGEPDPENIEDEDGFDIQARSAERRDTFEIDPEELLRGMNMPESLEDSMSYLGGGRIDHKRRTNDRRSSVAALEELEADLRDLLNRSDEVIPASRKESMMRRGTREASVAAGGRQMSILDRQTQRDSAEEEVLSQIRGFS